jgi:putative MATE family efflux protein
MRDNQSLLTAPIGQVLTNKTIPMMFGIVAILLMNLVDAYFISLLGTEALAAISYTFPVTFGINSITMGVGLGLSTYVGRNLGKGDHAVAARYSSHGILLAVGLVIIASYFGFTYHDNLFIALGAEFALIPLIREYMLVFFATIPLLVIPMTGNAAIRATGDTKTPAQIMMVAAMVNAIFDPLLIFGVGSFEGYGIMGAAIASAISWLIAVIWSLTILVRREKLLTFPNPLYVVQDGFNILKLGTPAALSNALAPLSTAILMKVISSHGIAAIAAYGAAQRIESVLLLATMALNSVLNPFMAQNFGAGNDKRSFDGLFMAMRFSVLFQLFVFIVMVPLSSSFTTLFTSDVVVADYLWLYLVLVPVSYGFQGIMMMVVSTFNSLHQPLNALKWSLLRLFVFTLPLALLFSFIWGVEGLFVGLTMGNIAGGILAYKEAIRIRETVLSSDS